MTYFSCHRCHTPIAYKMGSGGTKIVDTPGLHSRGKLYCFSCGMTRQREDDEYRQRMWQGSAKDKCLSEAGRYGK